MVGAVEFRLYILRSFMFLNFVSLTSEQMISVFYIDFLARKHKSCVSQHFPSSFVQKYFLLVLRYDRVPYAIRNASDILSMLRHDCTNTSTVIMIV